METNDPLQLILRYRYIFLILHGFIANSYIGLDPRNSFISKVDIIIIILLQNPASESVKCALHLLTTSAVRLQEECHECDDTTVDSEEMNFDPALKTQQVIQCAYDIAKSAKQLVTLFQQ